MHRFVFLVALVTSLLFCIVSLSPVDVSARAPIRPYSSRVASTLIGLLHSPHRRSSPHQEDYKSVPCAICTIGISSLVYQSEQSQTEITTLVDDLCNLFQDAHQPKLATLCKDVWTVLGPAILEMIAHGDTSDSICRDLHICNNATCSLGPLADKGSDPSRLRGNSIMDGKLKRSFLDSEIAFVGSLFRSDDPFWPWEKIKDHLPVVDLDSDRFSSIETLRGGDWRGKDCNDDNSEVYPGREHDPSKVHEDDNCNGIFGVDPSTGEDYETKLCSHSHAKGVIVLGDSASAHFHIPQNLTANLLEHLLEDEADFPQCSWSTGHLPSSSCPPAAGLGMDSVYLRMRNTNRCNHRDFENISVNGARSTGMMNGVIQSIQRNISTDLPAIVFYALVGNDICNPHPGTSHMTQPDQFHQKVTEAMQYLQGILPNGSHVILVGLEHGEMYAEMGQRIHPGVGVKYASLWDFTICVGVNPCVGWLSPDPSLRAYSIDLAAKLDRVLQDIASTQTYPNFDIHYFENPGLHILQAWRAAGNNTADLFEWVDGGHPSQVMQVKTAEFLWNRLSSEYPEIIGPENPYNDEIEKIFGAQGGY